MDILCARYVPPAKKPRVVHCRECGGEMHFDCGLAHHTAKDGGIDYATDRDHVAIRDDEGI